MHHPAVSDRVGKSARRAVLQRECVHLCIGDDGEVRIAGERIQEHRCRRLPYTIERRELIEADAFLALAVEIVIVAIAGLLCGLHISE